MRHEDYHDLLHKLPWEQRKPRATQPYCPKCGENYCGDGKSLCTECEFQLAELAKEQP